MTQSDPPFRDSIDIQKRPTRPGSRDRYKVVDRIDDDRLEEAAERRATIGDGDANVEDLKEEIVVQAVMAAIEDLAAAGARGADIIVDARCEIPGFTDQ